VRAGIRGWTMQTRGLPGKPDFFFAEYKVALFLDGCFWHGCPDCGHVPRVNRPFWKAKIGRNKERDRVNADRLKEQGIRVVRFWEHELPDGARCLRRLALHLRSGRQT